MRPFAYGRFDRVPSRTWERVLAQRGGKRVKRIGDADLVVVGAGAVSRPPERIWTDLTLRRPGTPLMGERSFLRGLGLVPDLPAETRPYSEADLAARARLSPGTVSLLALFGVVEADAEGRFGFRALKAITQAAELLKSVGLQVLVETANQLRRSPGLVEPFAELQLAAQPDGTIALISAGQAAELTGQMRLGLPTEHVDVAELIQDAGDARDMGDADKAARLYRRALARAPRDLDALFELGSLLSEAGDFAEGIALLQNAVRIDPSFADAYYNLGHAYERQGRSDTATAAYKKAADADPAYPDPLFNLGMMALHEDRFSDAIVHLDAYLSLDRSGEWADRARKAAALARLSLIKAAG